VARQPLYKKQGVTKKQLKKTDNKIPGKLEVRLKRLEKQRSQQQTLINGLRIELEALRNDHADLQQTVAALAEEIEKLRQAQQPVNAVGQ
jgi:uncharacterized coiled-coil protein SlyX